MSTEITPPEAAIQPVPTQEAIESPVMTAPSLDALIAEANSAVPQVLGDPVSPEATASVQVIDLAPPANQELDTRTIVEHMRDIRAQQMDQSNAETAIEASVQNSRIIPDELSKQPELVVPTVPTKARTCKITDHFSLNFIELMKQAPNNPLTRAHMLKVLKQMPPPEVDKFFKLMDWVEFNFPSSFTKKPVYINASPARFELEFNVTRTDIGSASYRINRSGTWFQSYSMAELREWIEENEDNFDDLQSRFYEKARDNESCELEDSGGYEYSGHEDTDSDGTNLDLQGDDNDRRQDLLNFLRANGGEDLAQMLDDRA